MENKRLAFIDALKGFGIICITLGHLNCDIWLKKYLYSFHVPLFFFISGYLYNGDKYSIGSYIKKKTLRLLVPFLVWGLLCSTTALIKGSKFLPTLFKFLTVDGKLLWNSPIWFLLVLYIADILYMLLCKISNKLYFKLIVFAVSCTLFVLFGDIMLTAKLNLVPYALMFYALGNIIKTLELQEKLEFNLITKIIVCVVLGVSGYLLGSVFNIRIVYTLAQFGNIAFSIISAVANVLFLYILFKNVKFIADSKLLSYLGENSLIIMISQYPVLWGLNALSLLIFKLRIVESHLFISLPLTALTITIICLFANLFKHLAKKSKAMDVVCKILGIN